MEKIQRQSNWFARHKILTGVLIFIVGGLFIGAVSSGSKQNTAKAQYAAEVRDHNVIDPGTLRLDVKVRNTGAVSGKPSCFMQAGKPTAAYHGVDRVTRDEELKPGEWWGFTQQITISKEGAPYIDDADISVTCD